MNFTKLTTHDLGRWGENYAKDYLTKQGYKVIDQNWRYSKYGEIDIICLYKKKLVFVEVKTRRSNHSGYPIEAVTKSKLKTIHKLANLYLQKHESLFVSGLKVEVVGIIINDNIPEIQHIKQVGWQTLY